MKRRAEDDEDMDGLFDMFGGPKTFKVSCVKGDNDKTLYSIFIYSEIKNADQFAPAIEALLGADEEDTVVVHLSTPGGSVDATDTFVHALTCCRARVLFIASGGVHSAGTLILMHAPEVTFSSGFNALVHNGVVGYAGKTSDFDAATTFMKKQMHKLLKSTYEGFLTAKEIEALIHGKDFWMDADEFKQRLLKRNKYFKKKKV